MLPQFPRLQRDLASRVMEYTAAKKNALLGALGDIPSHRVFEGHQNTITRADGGHEETEMATVRAELSIPFDEFSNLTLPGLLDKFNSIAQQLAQAQAEHMFATIARATAAAGNEVDAKGQKFSADLYLQVLQKMAIDFGEDGKAKIPTLHINPTMAETVKSVLTELQNDPNLLKRFQKVIENKHGEWRAREAGRELVG